MGRKAKAADWQVKIAMVLLHSAGEPDVPALLEYARGWAGLELSVDEATEGIATFQSGDSILAAALMPAPVPPSEFEQLAPFSWHWPEAVKEIELHEAHMILSVSQKEESKIELASLLTKFAASVAATSDSLAVYWSEGPVIYPRDAFLEFAEMLKEKKLPIPLWVGCYRGISRTSSEYLFTLGMEQFGHREVEMEISSKPSMGDVSLIYALANYILTSRKVIHEGDTVGDEDSSIRVHFRPSVYDADREAIVLVRN
jgi:hypothetical protein